MTSDFNPPWWAFALCSSVVWGIYYVMADRYLKEGVMPITFMFYHAIGVVIMCLILTLSFPQYSNLNIGIGMASQISAMSILTFVASWMIFYGIKISSATHVSSVEITYPIFVSIFAALIAGQTLSLLSYGAIGIIVIGVALFIHSTN